MRSVLCLTKSAGNSKRKLKRNTRVDSSQTKGSWQYVVDEGEKKVTVGSPLQNAIWEEFGTGEHAIHGDGRKGCWSYQDIYGKWHRTRGKKPSRALQRAFDSRKSAIVRIVKERFGVELR